MIRPPRLRLGARVLLVSPAGPSPQSKIQRSRDRCRELGFEPILAEGAHEQLGYLAGSDDVRLRDLQRGFDDERIDAVWAIRGGYGTTRIVPALDFAAMRERPKAFIGFSDNTAIHLALQRAGIVSFHGPHAGGALPDAAEKCLSGVLQTMRTGAYPAAPGRKVQALQGGSAEGALYGGNLALLAACCGTELQPDARGRILFIEDVGETVYRIDRMLVQLEQSGAVRDVAGIVFGQFTEIPKCAQDLPLEHVLREWVERLGVPAICGFPVGHVDDNWTLPLGVRARLDADAGTLELLEPAVA